MYGGAFHAIVPASGEAKTVVKIADPEKEIEAEVEIKTVGPFTSTLYSAAMAVFDKQAALTRPSSFVWQIILQGSGYHQKFCHRNYY